MRTIFDIPSLKSQIQEIYKQLNQPSANAVQARKQLAFLEEQVAEWEALKNEIHDLQELCSLKDVDKSLQQEIYGRIKEIEHKCEKYEIQVFLSEEYDKRNAYVSIYGGTGGDDAADWARMLLRMYERYCASKNYAVQQTAVSYNDKGGVKEATLYIQAPYAYGMLNGEAGVHRLVRLSPFSSAKLRHTSFALVDVIPELEDKSVSVQEQDMRIDFFRASGPGGQNVNKRDTAVRITHIPTSVSAISQGERSQLANKERAYNILVSKLYMLQSKESAQKIADIKPEVALVQWGSQIRSYVLHPYQKVKDHRTQVESQNTDKVLNGDLDAFIESFIRL